ncbi:MAG: ComEC/Rec2 family competence protein [Ginsengibacter sp.]
MAKSYHIYIWKKAPFLRLLTSLIIGIIIGFYLKFEINSVIIIGVSTFIFYVIFYFQPEHFRYKYRVIQGLLISCLFVLLGIFITWQKDVRNHKDWYGKKYTDRSFFLVTLNEPPVEKAKTFKILSEVESVITNDYPEKKTGKLLLYFSKDSLLPPLKYGDRILIKNKLKPIQNSGNPGGFDYAQYMAFQQIYHQVYLKHGDYIIVKGSETNFLQSIIFSSRDYVIKTLHKYIPEGNESALANALLIGYRVDLDKDLVQAYSNAGVVHLIAISGLHLALIYALLLWITLKIPYLKKAAIPRILVILVCLWFFALLTGAPPSVLRAGVMFSFISIGTLLNKKGSIFNSLAVSAFVILCFNPFILWDVGFQLSYLAVLGIVICQKPIFNWFYFKNKILNNIWAIASVSIAAQIFTIPICFYYFHQLPLLFLVANVIAIPLSTVALWGCVALVALSPFEFLAMYFGKLVWVFLWLMNHSVLLINELPFVIWNNISISVTDTFLLYLIFIVFLIALFKKNKRAFQLGLLGVIIFSSAWAIRKWNFIHQRKMVVYHIPMHQAIDFILGNNYYLVADSAVQKDEILQNFNLKPSRLLSMANKKANNPPGLVYENGFYYFFSKKIFIVDTAVKFLPNQQKIALDYLIVSKNPKIKIADLAKVFDCNQYIFDGSNSLWRIGEWKKECEELHLRSHSVSEDGAFVTSF